MFDNGNDHRFHDPPAPWYSRACEYVLDEKAKTATLVWQFDDGRRDSSGFMGNVQRLDNGNTFISWGGVNMHSSYGPAITEVDSTGAIKFELYMQAPYLTYRAYRYEWNVPARLEGVTPHYQSDIPAAPTLSDAYPNPAVSSSNIAIGLPQEMVADLRIYDALGHEAARLASGLLSQGPHTFSFDGSKLSAGVYHCILQAGGKTLATQIVLSK
jgi:hypothetical protein